MKRSIAALAMTTSLVFATSAFAQTLDKVVKVETLVYSLVQDQLVWAGVSRTVDPARIDDFITELAAAVTNQMAKEGLLTKG